MKELENIQKTQTAGLQADAKVHQTRMEQEAEFWQLRTQSAERAAQQEMRSNVRTNIGRSQAARRGSGFADFSADAADTGRYGQTRGEREIEVIRRRNRVSALRRRRGRGSMLGNAGMSAVMGGAFPLLFGQGPGTSIGGAVGGGVGGAMGSMGGMALGIAGSAAGQAVDNLVMNINNLATSLKEPTKALEAMEMAGLQVSDALKSNVDFLMQANDTYGAQSLVLRELKQQLGGNAGIQQLNALNEEQKKLQDAWKGLSATLTTELVPVITGLTASFTDMLGSLKAIYGNELVQLLLGAGATALTGGAAVSLGLAAENAGARGRQAASRQSSNLPPPLTRDQAITEGITRRESSLQRDQSILTAGDSLADQVRQADQTARDLARQRFEIVKAQEQQIADLRLATERRVSDLRLAVLARANEVEDARGQLRVSDLQLQNQNGLRQQFTSGSPADQVAQELANLQEGLLAIEEAAAKRKRDAALEVQRIDIQTERFKVDTALQVARINEAAAKQIDQINRNTQRNNEKLNASRFVLERDIAAARLEAVEQEALLLAQAAALYGNEESSAKFQQQAEDSRAARQRLNQLRPPAPAPLLAQPGNLSVSTAAYEAQANALKRQIDLLQQVGDAQDENQKALLTSRFENSVNNAFFKQITDSKTALRNQAATYEKYPWLRGLGRRRKAGGY